MEKMNTADLPLPPGKMGFPLLGETISFVRSTNDFGVSRRAKYGDVFKTNILFANTIFLSGSEGAAWIFAGENKYLKNSWAPPIARLLGGRSTAMLTGKQHLERRRLLAPTYSYAAMRSLIPRMREIAQRHFSAILGEEVDAVELFRGIAFEIIATMNIDDPDLDLARLSVAFKVWSKGLFTPLPFNIPILPYGKSLRAKGEILAYLSQFVHKRRNKTDKPDDLLTKLLATEKGGEPLADEVIAEEILLQLFAGHDTTVTNLSNMTLLLSQHPKSLQQLETEVVNYPTNATLDDLRGFSYLMQVIQETMRLIPPVGGAFREITEDTSYKGFKIPKGWKVMLGIRPVHHDDDWPEAEKFDPDRFSPDRARPGKSFIPFGGGPRICLGQHFAMAEMSVILFELVRHFTWTLKEGQDFTYTSIPFPLPKHGVFVRLARR